MATSAPEKLGGTAPGGYLPMRCTVQWVPASGEAAAAGAGRASRSDAAATMMSRRAMVRRAYPRMRWRASG